MLMNYVLREEVKPQSGKLNRIVHVRSPMNITEWSRGKTHWRDESAEKLSIININNKERNKQEERMKSSWRRTLLSSHAASLARSASQPLKNAARHPALWRSGSSHVAVEAPPASHARQSCVRMYNKRNEFRSKQSSNWLHYETIL